jgi:hypothetical protein
MQILGSKSNVSFPVKTGVLSRFLPIEATTDKPKLPIAPAPVSTPASVSFGNFSNFKSNKKVWIIVAIAAIGLIWFFHR